MKLAFTKKAKQDLDHIAIQVAAHDIDIAVQLVIDIEHRARILLDSPSMGRPTPRPGVRELVIDPYVLPYRVMNERVVVLRVWHGRQRWWG